MNPSPEADIERTKKAPSPLETTVVFIDFPDASARGKPFGGVKRSGYRKRASNLGTEGLVNKKLVLVPKFA